MYTVCWFFVHLARNARCHTMSHLTAAGSKFATIVRAKAEASAERRSAVARRVSDGAFVARYYIILYYVILQYTTNGTNNSTMLIIVIMFNYSMMEGARHPVDGQGLESLRCTNSLRLILPVAGILIRAGLLFPQLRLYIYTN